MDHRESLHDVTTNDRATGPVDGRAQRPGHVRRDGTTDDVAADGMWPAGMHLVFRYSEVVILTPRPLVALRVPIAEVERVIRDDGEVWRPDPENLNPPTTGDR
jgi:hypothetical protein